MHILDELKKQTPTISVGILTADMMNLGSELKLIENAGVKLLHFDIMDGCFCPMITIGPSFIKAIRTPMLKDVHLMIDEPLNKIDDFVTAGADMITINVESCSHLHQALQKIRRMENVNDHNRGILRSISLNPSTDIYAVEPVIDEVEMVLLLAVNPGYSGQKFITSTEKKLASLKELIRRSGKHILTCIDGGINKDNIAEPVRGAAIPNYNSIKQNVLQAGALGLNISGGGSSVFAICHKKDQENIAEVMAKNFSNNPYFDKVLITTTSNNGIKILSNI